MRNPAKYGDIIALETALAASVAELRERFPRTPDLYREVCVLLSFRHGITPTANKLYQLVRKGSMSAPTEALNHFWKTLRERSRVTIEHTDLPEELRTAAGALVATLWKSAQSKSLQSLATLQAEAAAAVDSAKADQASEQADRTRLAEDRFADMEKRALQEVDRERTATAKLGKVIEAERAKHIAAITRARVDHDAAQAKIAELRERIGALQNAVEVLESERDRERQELQAVRAQLEAAIRQSAADSGRAEHLHDELERHRNEAQAQQNRAAGLSAKSKRRSKAGRVTDA
jgi:DNA repair exonuclease SbcCD ATPase subunit